MVADVSKYKNVLVARFSALGDVAMTVPVVYSACMAYPGVRFVMVTQPVASSLFVGKPANLTVLGVDVKGRYRGVRGMWRLVGELRRDYAIDAFIDLHDVIRTQLMGLFFRMRGIPVARIDKGRDEKRRLTRRRAKELTPLISSRQRYYDAYARFGFCFREEFKTLFPKPARSEEYAGIAPPKRLGEKWIAIAPFAKHAGKIYPPGLMSLVVDRLASCADTRIFLFGGGGAERELLERWEKWHPAVVTSLAGKRYGFPKELALLSHADVMLSMDSANMHLASLVGLPVVSVWGATHPYCGFTGWRQPHELEVQSDLPCRPCSVFGNKPCERGDYACLRSIAPETIVERIEKVIDGRK